MDQGFIYETLSHITDIYNMVNNAVCTIMFWKLDFKLGFNDQSYKTLHANITCLTHNTAKNPN